MVDFTVAIPTYNGADRLPLVLEKLRSQLKADSFSWNILVVDNNSSDQTAQVVRSYRGQMPVPLLYVLETRQGSGFARQRAMQISDSPLVGFLDDDNLPEENWVASAYQFGQVHPAAGAYASRIDGEFESEIPPGFDRLLPFFALTQRGEVPRLYDPAQKILPPSAGLVLRKQAWTETIPKNLILVGRINGDMIGGEDLEMMSHMQQSSWEIWYNPAMHVVHKIPDTRLQQPYLLSFFRGVGLSRHVTRMLSVKPWQRPLMFVAYLVNDLRKILRHYQTYGKAAIEENLVLKCELELFRYSLVSPFYLWRHGYLKKSNS